MMLSSLPSQSAAEVTAVPPDADTCEAIVFLVDGYPFALPLGAIVRIVSGRSLPKQQQNASWGNDTPLYLFDGKPLPLVDLRHALAQVAAAGAIAQLTPPDDGATFLIVVRLSSQQCCGILVDQLPQIQYLPLAQVHTLPGFYQQKIANLASHAVIQNAESEGNPSILFLLDLKAFLTL